MRHVCHTNSMENKRATQSVHIAIVFALVCSYALGQYHGKGAGYENGYRDATVTKMSNATH